MYKFIVKSSVNSVKHSEEGLIILTFVGDQTVGLWGDVAKVYLPILTEKYENKEKVLILIDLKDLGKMTSGFMRKIFQITNFVRFDKTAIVGINKFTKQVIIVFIKSSRIKGEIKFFDEIDDANEWLLGNK